MEKEETIQITNRFAQRNVETTNDERQETTERHEDIAIIGVSGIYPESGDLDELWSNLVQKKDCIRVIPKERWDYTKYYDIQKGRRERCTVSGEDLSRKWINSMPPFQYVYPRS